MPLYMTHLVSKNRCRWEEHLLVCWNVNSIFFVITFVTNINMETVKPKSFTQVKQTNTNPKERRSGMRWRERYEKKRRWVFQYVSPLHLLSPKFKRVVFRTHRYMQRTNQDNKSEQLLLPSKNTFLAFYGDFSKPDCFQKVVIPGRSHTM